MSVATQRVSRLLSLGRKRRSIHSVDIAEWNVVRIARRRDGASLAVQTRSDRSFTEARLALVERKSLNELILPMTIGDSVAEVDLAFSTLKFFGSATLDLWIEISEPGRMAVRRRVLVDPDQFERELGPVPRRKTSWYATRKGNLSVKVADVRGGVTEAPILEGVDAAGSEWILTLKDAPATYAHRKLVLRAQKSGRTVGLSLSADSDVTFCDDDLSPLGAQPCDAFVTSSELSGAMLRLRLIVGPGTVLGSDARSLWDWHQSAAGHLMVSHVSPAKTIALSGVFDEEFYRSQVPGLAPDEDPIEHYVNVGAADGLNPSKMFDTKYYLRANPAVRVMNPLQHYCEYGWKELRNPSALFDTWWYWSKNLDLGVESVMPLAHYEREGKFQDLSTRPSRFPSRHLSDGHRWDDGQVVRRVCLFAAYDADGIVDDYVVDYLRELSRFADVYYLADSDMADAELAKLADVTVGAWAKRHGEYDFGSYKRLAEEVGWATIESYDELLLVNDSCYLLRPLDDVFREMDERACDWWGLQATKGIGANRRAAEALFRDPIPMESVRYSMIDGFEDDYRYDFHMASYFLAYRTPVIQDPEFRRYLGSVTAQRNKQILIQKYEIGLTRWLLQHGHSFDTFVTKLYPFHPVFTQWYFRLLDEGFPLFKRFFLTSNHYHVPRLHEWKKLLLEKVPTADVESFERNLLRVAEPETLRENLWIGTEEGVEDLPVHEKLLTNPNFVLADRRSPKHANWWAFPVCAYTHNFSGNERAIFEQVKNDPSIRKVVLTRSKDIVVDGVNVDVVPLESPEGQYLLMRSGVILIRHSVALNAVYPVSAGLHNIIQLWHGVPFKRIAYVSEDFKHALAGAAREHAQYRAVIASSKVDSLAMAAAFFPLTSQQVWNTGLPRNDFILQDEQDLAPDLAAELAKLRSLVAGRRLVLFMPTFRNSQDQGHYRFDDHEVEWLSEWLETNNCVLGLREHMADSAQVYGSQLAHLPMLDLSDAEFVHPEMLYRIAEVLITDYSSAFVDYMLTGKAAVSFAFDLELYEVERGSFYELDQVFPGPIAKDFGELREALTGIFDGANVSDFSLQRSLLHDYVDANSSTRVVERIRALGETHGLGTWSGQREA